MKALLTAVLLAAPAFSSVLYDVRTKEDLGFSVLTTDFLPNLNPGKLSWDFSPQDMKRFDCGAGNMAPGVLFCTGTYLNTYGGIVTAGVKMRDQFFNPITTFESYFTNASLGGLGQWTSTNGSTVLTVSLSDESALAPEPSSLLLGLLGMGLISVKCARRLFHRAVDSEVIIRLPS